MKNLSAGKTIEKILNLFLLIGGTSFIFFFIGLINDLTYYWVLKIPLSFLDFQNYYYYIFSGVMQGITLFVFLPFVVIGWYLLLLEFRKLREKRSTEHSEIEAEIKDIEGRTIMNKEDLEKLDAIKKRFFSHKEESNSLFEAYENEVFNFGSTKKARIIFLIIICGLAAFSVVCLNRGNVGMSWSILATAINLELFRLLFLVIKRAVISRHQIRLIFLAPIILSFIFIVLPVLDGFMTAKIKIYENDFRLFNVSIENEPGTQDFKYVLFSGQTFFFLDNKNNLLIIPESRVIKMQEINAEE